MYFDWSADLFYDLVDISKKFSKEHFNSITLWTPSILSPDNYERAGYDASFGPKGNAVISNNTVVGHHCPTGCYNVYSMLKGKTIPFDTGYTLVNKCVRGEVDDTHLLNFSVFESVHIGSYDYCVKTLSKACSFQTQLLDHFGIEWRLERTHDQFFGQDAEKKAKAQKFAGSKLELQALVDERWVAVTSYNLLGSSMLERFDISGAECSCCWGWGLERTVELLSASTESLTTFKYEDRTNSDYLNTLKKEKGWHIVDGVEVWVSVRDLTYFDTQHTPDEYGFTIIETVEQLEKNKEAIQKGIFDLHDELKSTWPAIWDYEEAVKRLEKGAVLVCNIVDNRAVQFHWYWFGKFVLLDHGWNKRVWIPDFMSYGANWWCNPAFRSHKDFISSFYDNMMVYLKSRGVSMDLAIVDGWNKKAISIGKKYGYVGSRWLELYGI